jgi:hypothetical protein
MILSSFISDGEMTKQKLTRFNFMTLQEILFVHGYELEIMFVFLQASGSESNHDHTSLVP